MEKHVWTAEELETKCLLLPDWVRSHERSDTRRYKHPDWVPFPLKLDGKGYGRIMALPYPQNVSVFTAYSLIVEVCAKMPERGILMDLDGPLDTLDLATKTHAPVEIFEMAIDVLQRPKIGWLTVGPVDEWVASFDSQRMLKLYGKGNKKINGEIGRLWIQMLHIQDNEDWNKNPTTRAEWQGMKHKVDELKAAKKKAGKL